MAVVEGDPTKGPSHFLMKFPAGFAAPMHHHTPDHYVTVISGTMVLTSNGKEEKLPAGSFFSFVGKSTHTTACAAGAPCVIMVDARGKWDVVMKDGKFAEAPFQAEGKVLGGTGKLEKAGGTVRHAGKATSEGGTYSLTLDAGG